MFSEVDKRDYDYLIGSVHYLKKGDRYIGFDRDAATVSRIVREDFGGDGMAFVRSYYEHLSELPTHGDFDIIGHFDIHLKLNESVRFVDETSKEYLSLAFDALHALAGQIPLAEINTGAIARGYRSVPYPTLPVLKEMKRLGFGILFTSDCHDKNYFDCAFDTAEEIALAAGYREYYVLTADGFHAVPLG